MRKKALLLSAYNAGSHQQWHQMLTKGVSDYEWTVITLPAHHFFWRARSNGLSFALEHREQLVAGHDVLIATSMLDLATLRGLVPELAVIPALVYFHENQFDYPLRSPELKQRIVNAQFTSIVTAICAKRVLFNSDYNRQTFLSGTQKFIRQMPDGLSPSIATDIDNKSAVVPVPIKDIVVNRSGKTGKTVDLVWAHRWEYDKQPEVFFNALEKLYSMPDFAASGLTIQLHVMGQSFREVPDCFEQAQQSGIHNIITWGYQSRDEYYQILANADFVISTALHDFQGLGMMEAIHQGCIPVAPGRVAYPEYIPGRLLYDVSQPEHESTELANKLSQLICSDQNQNQDLHRDQNPVDVSAYLENQLIARYQTEIDAL